jgi:hypothetical protein
VQLEHLLNVSHGGGVVALVVISEQLLVLIASSGANLIELVVSVGIVLFTTAKGDARDGAKHDGEKCEGDEDKNI